MVELLEILKALSDETRYKLIKMLLQHNFCVGALAKKLEITESAVSQHLKILRNAELIQGEKRGYYTHYFVNRKQLKKAAKKISELSELLEFETECKKNSKDFKSCCRKDEPGYEGGKT